MFWSLILEPGKRYSSTVKETFHLSMAALKVKTVKTENDIYPVLIDINGQELVLCNLSKSKNLHANLDLIFSEGTNITFSTSGNATIHLTGYLIQDDASEDGDLSSVSDEEEESLSDFVSNLKKSEKQGKVNQKEQKKNQQPVKRKLEQPQAGSKKKPKVKDESDDDSSNDLDENTLGKLVDSINDDEDDESSDLNSDDFDDEDEDSEDVDNEEDDDDDDDDEDDDDESEEEKFQTPKSKKDNQQKTPQPKTPIDNKKDKKQLTNGATPESVKTPKNKEKNANTPSQKIKGTPHPQKNANTSPQKNANTSPQKNADVTPQSQKKANATPQSQKKQSLPGGIVVEELKPGQGPVAKAGKMVSVYYTGRLKSNNRVFDQTNQGNGFKFRLGNNEVIKGWDVGLNGMKVGSKRRITIPPAMAYGNKGSPPQIPPNSWLVFDVELKSVN